MDIDGIVVSRAAFQIGIDVNGTASLSAYYVLNALTNPFYLVTSLNPQNK